MGRTTSTTTGPDRRRCRARLLAVPVSVAAVLVAGACDGPSEPAPGRTSSAAGGSLPAVQGTVSAETLLTKDDVTGRCESWVGDADAVAAAVGLQGPKFGWGTKRSTGTSRASRLSCSLIRSDQGMDLNATGAVTFRLVQGQGSTGTGPAGLTPPSTTEASLDSTAATKGDLTVQVDGSSSVTLTDDRRKALAQQLLDRLG